ncbi:MAG: hypothetical protein KKE44_24305 [Proteobacteria bacterium]|nr:hypothetical protein [Pseudomonadota bacterium]MBU1585855.1 hypothetical protein [Pseudomonadota bacterium]MBU2455135.1 hypothetical protein [Pseudomonadota bacterium]
MEINSLQGAAAYANVPNATPPVDNTRLREQNVEASRTDLNTENTQAAQQAFEVTLTREAQDRLAAQKAEASNAAQTQPPENQNNGTIAQTYETSQIVNIVA